VSFTLGLDRRKVFPANILLLKKRVPINRASTSAFEKIPWLAERPAPGRPEPVAFTPHLSTIGLAYPAQDIAFAEYRQAVKDSHERLERLTEALRAQSSQWRMNPLVQALMSLRGFDFVAAVIIAEIGDPRRFAHPRALMAYLGLVPSEFSTGQTRHQGSITNPIRRQSQR
jgi:transposase